MKKESVQFQGTTAAGMKVTRLTTRDLHFNMFKYLNSRKSECLVITHRGEPRMIAFLIDPKIGYAALAGKSELVFRLSGDGENMPEGSKT
jgi:hypothetical protein